MMEIGDCVSAITQFMDADNDILTQRTYNLAAASFTPKQLAESIRRHVPDFEIICESDSRQAIADSWPDSFDDANARRDWGWQHELGTDGMVDFMITRLSEIHGKGPV